MPERIVVISGPTASGKSDLALHLSDLRDVAIINADSLQIYEGLPILSSQPTQKERNKAPHFLYSHLKPHETSSVGTWLKLVKSTVEKVRAEKKLPIIVGGSGMYISKLIDGISEIPEISDDIKKEARELFEEIGLEEFKKKVGADNIIDKQRLIRAY
jgi:tRNA dimethylallyltransferase